MYFFFVSSMKVIHPFDSQADGELSISVGDIVAVRQVPDFNQNIKFQELEKTFGQQNVQELAHFVFSLGWLHRRQLTDGQRESVKVNQGGFHQPMSSVETKSRLVNQQNLARLHEILSCSDVFFPIIFFFCPLLCLFVQPAVYICECFPIFPLNYSSVYSPGPRYQDFFQFVIKLSRIDISCTVIMSR